VKVAAYQAPLLRSGSLEAVDLIRTRVAWCESHGVVILCCPEAILGGLADYAADPREVAIDARGDRLARVLGRLTFGIVICNDSNYPEPARIMASKAQRRCSFQRTTAFLRRRRMSPHTREVSTSRWR